MAKQLTIDDRAKASESLRALAECGQVPTWPMLSEAVMGTRQCMRRDVVGRLADLAAVTATEEDHERQRAIIRDLERKRDEALREARHRERTRLSIMQVLAVVTEMEHHALGAEGAEDSPVARWAARLREAVRCSAELAEDARAAKWVREHGGIEELDRRLMPPGMEWPRFEDGGEKVRLRDEFIGKDGKTYIVNEAKFIGKCFSLFDFCDRKPQFTGFYGERVKRPKPAPVGANGVPLKAGETVRGTGRSQHEFEVLDTHDVNPEVGSRFSVKCFDKNEGEVCWCDPKLLTHTKPELTDSWEKIYSDCELTGEQYVEERMDEQPDDMTPEMAMALDLVRRTKALAERERGER